MATPCHARRAASRSGSSPSPSCWPWPACSSPASRWRVIITTGPVSTTIAARSRRWPPSIAPAVGSSPPSRRPPSRWRPPWSSPSSSRGWGCPPPPTLSSARLPSARSLPRCSAAGDATRVHRRLEHLSQREDSMRAWIVAAMVAAWAGLVTPAAAQEADALRREIEQLRQQSERAQREYQKALEALTERLQRLESRPQQPATAPVIVQAPSTAAPPSLTDLARPRQPFTLYGERRQGQFLLDFGVVGDFVGNITQRNVEKAQAGTFFGRENRFFPREVELMLFGQIDPYARGEVRI